MTAPPVLRLAPGGQLHTATCIRIRRTSTVPFPVDGSSADLSRQVAFEDLHPCRGCKPISRYSNWEKFHARTHDR